MLSTAKMGTGSWPYYAQQVGKGACEYYLGVGEDAGRWHGRGLEWCGIVAGSEVDAVQLDTLFGEAQNPSTGQPLGQPWRADGVTGFDLCFSAPKSVSALWALADPQVAGQVRQAHTAAVHAALGYLDSHAALSRVGRNGLTQVGTGGFAAATFDHRTSRAGDPQLHSHALVVNKLRCADGGWRAIDGVEIYAHKKSAGMLYQAALRAELTSRLGVAWSPVSEHGQAEIVGVPTRLVERWSTRAGQVLAEAGPVIAAYEERLGRPLTSAERTAVTKVAVIKTRPAKEYVEVRTLRERWADEANVLGVSAEDLLARVVRADGLDPKRATTESHTLGRTVAPADARTSTAAGPQPAGRADTLRLLEAAVTAAGARRAMFSRSDLAGEIAARLPAHAITSADLVAEVVERLTERALELTIRLRDQDSTGPARASDARYASPTTLAAEQRILARTLAGRAAGCAPLNHTLIRQHSEAAGLDHGQRLAVRLITTSGDRVSVLVAPAGTGKTTTVGAAAHAWTDAGYTVLGLAPSARAARELASATGGRAETVAKLLHELNQAQTGRGHGGGLDRLGRLDGRTVLIVDEASMLATADLDTLTALTERLGSKLVLVGDPHQLATIDRAGGMLAPLAHATSAPTLEAVRRFHHDWERTASLLLRAGDPHALSAYGEHDRLHAHPDTGSAQQAVLAQWKTAAARGEPVLLLARSRTDVAELNTLAREHLIETGTINGPAHRIGPHEWQAGDRLRATRNDRRLPLADGHVRNGDIFTVLGSDPGGSIESDKDGGLRVAHEATGTVLELPADYVRAHATYGWASTIDSAQGATTEVAILLARPGLDREHLYVGLTRGRTSNHVHVAPTESREPHHLPQPPAADLHDTLHAMLARSGAESAAHTRLTDEQRQRFGFTPECVAARDRPGPHTVRGPDRQSPGLPPTHALGNAAHQAEPRALGR